MTETALGFVKTGSFQVPALIADIGPEATKRYFEFFTVPIRNKNTRIAYYHAIVQFLDWCQRAGFRGLEDIEPITVAAYVEQHPGSPATIKQHMSAIRMLFSRLTETFARIGAVVNLKVEDYFQTGKRSMIRFSEKGGKETEIPVHHKLEELLDHQDGTASHRRVRARLA
jgi:hypothetical protein